MPKIVPHSRRQAPVYAAYAVTGESAFAAAQAGAPLYARTLPACCGSKPFISFSWQAGSRACSIYHHACARLLRKLIDNRDQHSHRWFRFFNEVPVLLLVAIVVLVVVKPF
jgi:hypothetical protein